MTKGAQWAGNAAPQHSLPHRGPGLMHSPNPGEELTLGPDHSEIPHGRESAVDFKAF